MFGGISLIYLVVSLLLVRSLSISVGAGEIKDALQQVFSEQNGQSNQLAVGLTIYGLLVSNVNAAASSAGSVYQAIFLITFSLAIVWALRRWLADSTKKIRIRDAFYKGMYPLVPVILVFLVIGLQLIPVYIASFLFSAVFATGLAVTALEQITWASIIFLLTLLSLYMLSSSIFALYIATLPDVGPMQALRSARELVRHRRWIVLRKILFLPIAMVVLVALFIIPMILISPMVAEWTFFGLSALSLGVVHSYLYGLYRELL